MDGVNRQVSSANRFDPKKPQTHRCVYCCKILGPGLKPCKGRRHCERCGVSRPVAEHFAAQLKRTA